MEFETVIDRVRSRTEFGWGDGDCLFGLVVPVLSAITDRDDWFARFFKRYKTPTGALTVMRRAGFKNLGDLAGSELIEIHPSRCMVGDVVAIPIDDNGFGFALGICNGDTAFVLRENGLGYVSMSAVSRAFEVR